MAAGPLTQVEDLIIPENFVAYMQQMTEQKARLIQAGAITRSPLLDQFLAGGGNTINVPSFKDLDDDADNVSTDAVSDTLAWTALSGTQVGANYPTLNDAIPAKIGTSQEVAVRLSRNKAWSSSDLAGDLAGADPIDAIRNRAAYYWQRKLQKAFIATWNGVIKDNANDSNDYEYDASGVSFVEGVTNFTAENFLTALVTAGDSMDLLTTVMVHSAVYSRMQKNNLIDFIPDSRGEVSIPTFMGRQVIVDDGMPVTSSVYDTWIFGPGSTMLGMGSPKVPVEVERYALAGNGGGQEVLVNRLEWAIHPVGHAYVGSSPEGGPGNGTGSNDLNNAGSWDRVYGERKQVRFVRLVTREA